MDVSGKIDEGTKSQFGNIMVEIQVLENLLKERKEIARKMGNDLLKKLTATPDLYLLEINPSKNVWEMRLKDKLFIPGVSQSFVPKQGIRRN